MGKVGTGLARCKPNLDFLFAQCDLFHELQPGSFVGFGVPLVSCFEDCLVFRAVCDRVRVVLKQGRKVMTREYLVRLRFCRDNGFSSVPKGEFSCVDVGVGVGEVDGFGSLFRAGEVVAAFAGSGSESMAKGPNGGKRRC
jgi:hypothetical protein